MSLTEARHPSGVPRRQALNTRDRRLEPPFAVVDLDAFDRNAADLLRRAGGKPVRLASKSVRCRALIERALAAGLQGSSPSRCPRRCGWRSTATTTSSSPTRPSTARRCARWRPGRASA